MNGDAGSSGNEAPVPIAQANTSPSRRGPWPSAEDEKQRLYDTAKQQALKTQAIMSGAMGTVVSLLHLLFTYMSS